MFTKEELKNIAILINKASIIGSEAVTVAIIQQKIEKLLNEDVEQVKKGK